MYIVYKHTSATSGKSYIGLTGFSINKRWKEHTYQALVADSSFHFHRAINLYGKDDWSHETLFGNIETAREAQLLEKASIIKFDTFENGYNSNEGGLGNAGISPFINFSEEQKVAHSKKVSDNSLKHWSSEKHMFIHEIHGKTYNYISEVCNKYGVHHGQLSKVARGEASHASGWFLYNENAVGYETNPKYHFTHPDHGDEHLSLKDMVNKYDNLSKGNLSSVTVGRRNHTKQWRLKNML